MIGRLAAHEEVDVPIEKTETGEVHVGGWGDGFFKGDLDELRIYNRALSVCEIRLHAGKKPEDFEPVLAVSAGYSYHRKAFLCDLLWMPAGDEASGVDFVLHGPSGQDSLAARGRPSFRSARGLSTTAS